MSEALAVIRPSSLDQVAVGHVPYLEIRVPFETPYMPGGIEALQDIVDLCRLAKSRGLTVASRDEDRTREYVWCITPPASKPPLTIAPR